MKKILCIGLTIVLLLSGTMVNAAPTTLYASDGRNITIREEKDVQKWVDVGWHRPITLYAPDGRTLSVSPFEKQAWINVGWFEGVTIYAPDGRNATVPSSSVESYKNVGWYTYPVTTVYSMDGRSIVISKDAVEEYCKVGWYPSKDAVKTSINKGKINSIKYNASSTGALTGNITYQYNKFIGTKADVGADILLVQSNHIPLASDDRNFSMFTNFDDPTMYSTEVDGMGTYYFDNIPAGEYILIVKSRKTTPSPIERSLAETGALLYLEYKITDKAWENLKFNFEHNKCEFQSINITDGHTTRFSHDFGYTYI